jgi:hypothetical protein
VELSPIAWGGDSLGGQYYMILGQTRGAKNTYNFFTKSSRIGGGGMPAHRFLCRSAAMNRMDSYYIKGARF